MNNWNTLSDDAKIWLYGTNREITVEETEEIKAFLDNFCNEWAAHGTKLDCGFTVLYNRFIVLGVNEQSAAASGCSIDSSIHAFQDIDKKYNFDLFNRLRSYYVTESSVESLNNQEIQRKLAAQELSEKSMFIDPMVSTVGDLKNALTKPMVNTWLKKYL